MEDLVKQNSLLEIKKQFFDTTIDLSTPREDEKKNSPRRQNNPNSSFKLDSVIISNLQYDIKYSEGSFCKKKWKEKTILKEIDMVIKVGSLTAILGPSGAGKTTLLNFMALRVAAGSDPKGEYLVNGKDAYQLQSFRRGISYVLQEDVFLPYLTVRETLNIAAKLKLPRTMSDQQKMERVEEVMGKLNLHKCADTIVGEPGLSKGISGGEKKRLSIAVELITYPAILFVDEPTSGLDTVISFDVIEILKNLAREGITVITTIHQPSADIFELFDNVLIMKDGRILTYGTSEETMRAFRENGLECPEYTNPAEFYLDTAMDRLGLHKENLEEIMQKYHQRAVVEVEQAMANARKAKGLQKKKNPGKLSKSKSIVTTQSVFAKMDDEEEKLNKEYKETRNTWFYKYKVLVHRAFRNLLRDPKGLMASLISSIIMSIIIGLVFLRVANSDQSGVQNRLGALFFILINLGMSAIQALIATFSLERTVFLREYLGNMYEVSPYYFAKLTVSLPIQFSLPLIQLSIVYFMIGFQAIFVHFVIFVGVISMICLTMNGYGLAIAAGFKDIPTALSMVPVGLLPQIILCGYFINKDSIPPYLIWIHYISAFKYGYEILAITEFTGLTFCCTSSQYVNGTVCPITDGQNVINNLSLQSVQTQVDWGVLAVILFVAQIIGLITLQWRATKYKNTGTI